MNCIGLRFVIASISLGFIVGLAACSSSSLRINNYSYLYSKDLLLHPEFRVFNASNDTSYLYFKVSTLNLLYTRTAKNNDFAARLKVEVEAFSNFNDKFPLFRDSSEYIDTDNEQVEKDLIGRFAMPLAAGKNYLVKISITDENRKSSDSKLIRVFKEDNVISRQGFLGIDGKNMVPVIPKILTNEQRLLFVYRLGEQEIINVTYFSPSSRLARAPFDLEQAPREIFRPFKSYSIQDSSGFFPFAVPKEPGIFFVQNDTLSQSGTTFLKFSDTYPKVNTGDQLIGPIQYIASDEEYKELKLAANKKIAAENFWIRRCGSMERAKEVIKAFYRRVEEANEFFTSYKEGWKTDRGMIYIIFGPPDGLYMRDGGENWVYGQETNVNSINLLFIKNENPFSDNDLILQRSAAYRPAWYMAVDYWRTGRIFSL